MARKNFPIIYDQVYHPAILQYEQLRLAGRRDPPFTIILNECGLNSIITAMDDNGTVNMDLPATKFGVSTVLQRVCEVGMN